MGDILIAHLGADCTCMNDTREPSLNLNSLDGFNIAQPADRAQTPTSSAKEIHWERQALFGNNNNKTA